eukprot:CAMPEP_0183303346 /NCGR_PEP_ID=MMETSP0160_2-20130417/8822_1 /TAXON_ID=2839 ORGANISM="Odontella Sinensis, Strain Grunow 1884" /NCGR_SAMPLE_ID=MMETSP0160_2 /ASSEMBLY_ACC=CAM_ASM_000250 /LENGTH=140 /DNA_ID=CAMNT_0025466239 /DNA_START=212 /DNA_END=630 /DNA_ORIENTATION=-
MSLGVQLFAVSEPRTRTARPFPLPSPPIGTGSSSASCAFAGRYVNSTLPGRACSVGRYDSFRFSALRNRSNIGVERTPAGIPDRSAASAGAAPAIAAMLQASSASPRTISAAVRAGVVLRADGEDVRAALGAEGRGSALG